MSGCASTVERASPAQLERIRARAWRDRAPMNGALDLTYRCNFRCVHCYVGHLVGRTRSQAGELGTQQVKRLLEQMADAGCLFLVLSGGEPLLREDFTDVYKAARRLGMVVTVFTNASLVDDRHLEAFEEYPPHLVEVSLYGATEATCERVTGSPGSYARTMRGIERLSESAVRLGLKTMVLVDNVEEMADIEGLATTLGVGFRLDPVVVPRVDGNQTPLLQRVEPELAVSVEYGSAKRLSEAAGYLRRHEEVTAAPRGGEQRLFECGAGTTAFHVDPQGYLRPCVVGRGLAYNTQQAGFAGAWRNMGAAIRRATWEEAGVCAGCPDILLCGFCPGLLELEGPTSGGPPEYLCRLGTCRRMVIEDSMVAEGTSV